MATQELRWRPQPSRSRWIARPDKAPIRALRFLQDTAESRVEVLRPVRRDEPGFPLSLQEWRLRRAAAALIDLLVDIELDCDLRRDAADARAVRKIINGLADVARPNGATTLQRHEHVWGGWPEVVDVAGGFLVRHTCACGATEETPVPPAPEWFGLP